MNTAIEDRSAALASIANRYGVSQSAVEHLLQAVTSGGGNMAQFNHTELGGPGQWSSGGMLMIGDMFNADLKKKVAALCADVAQLMAKQDGWHAPLGQKSHSCRGGDHLASSSIHLWPEGLGQASSTGSQNDIHYAFFPESRRLVIKEGANLTLYDTGDHRIQGVSQQQSTTRTLRFTSQSGEVDLTELKKVDSE